MSEQLGFEVGVRFEVGVNGRAGAGCSVGVGPRCRVGVRSVGVALPEVGVGQRSQTAPTVGVPAYPAA